MNQIFSVNKKKLTSRVILPNSIVFFHSLKFKHKDKESSHLKNISSSIELILFFDFAKRMKSDLVYAQENRHM